MALTRSFQLDKVPQDILDMMAYLFLVGTKEEGQLEYIELNLGPNIWLHWLSGYDEEGLPARIFSSEAYDMGEKEMMLFRCNRAFVIKADCPGDADRGRKLYTKHFLTSPPENLNKWAFKGLAAHVILLFSFCFWRIGWAAFFVGQGVPKGVENFAVYTTGLLIITSCFLFSTALVASVYSGLNLLFNTKLMLWRQNTPFVNRSLPRRILNAMGFVILIMFLFAPHDLKIFLGHLF